MQRIFSYGKSIVFDSQTENFEFFFRSFQRWNIHTAIFNNRHAWEKIVNDQIDPFRRTLVQFRAEEAD